MNSINRIMMVNAQSNVPMFTQWLQSQKLLANDGFGIDYFGLSIAVNEEGTVAIIGSPYSDNQSINSGSAYVFTRTGSIWTQQSELLATDRHGDSNFGCSISLSSSGDIALIGAFGADDNKGAVYVFKRNGSVWTQQVKLIASDNAVGGTDDRFGFSVSLSGDGNVALIGAWLDDTLSPNSEVISGSGGAYVFVQSNNVWALQAKLVANDRSQSDAFGYYVSLSTDSLTALIGANQDNANQGSAYVFTRLGSVWTQQAKLTANDGVSNDYFGNSVSLSSDGNTALIGAYTDDSPGINAGSAYVFTRTGVTWTQQIKLLTSDSDVNDNFGWSVNLSSGGNIAIISASYDDTKGSAYIFTRSGAIWTQQTKLTASDGAASDQFGRNVAISKNGEVILIGAVGDDDKGNDSGAVYSFSGSF